MSEADALLIALARHPETGAITKRGMLMVGMAVRGAEKGSDPTIDSIRRMGQVEFTPNYEKDGVVRYRVGETDVYLDPLWLPIDENSGFSATATDASNLAISNRRHDLETAKRIEEAERMRNNWPGYDEIARDLIKKFVQEPAQKDANRLRRWILGVIEGEPDEAKKKKGS